MYLPKLIVASYIVVPVVAGIMIYICKRWSFYGYLACLAVAFLVSLYGFSTDVSLLNFVYLVGVLLVDFVLVAYFMVPAVRQIYLDPRLRWWESAPRYRADFEAEVVGNGLGQVVNISEGGLFFKSAAELADHAVIDIKFSYQSQSYLVKGVVVHHRNMGVHGYGIQFKHSIESAKAVKHLVSMMEDDGRRLHDRDPGEEDSFMRWLRELVSTGSGFIPKTPKKS